MNKGLVVKGKYIITILSPILFNEFIGHKEFIKSCKEIRSAGFYEIIKNVNSEGGFDIKCYGKSEGLDITSNPESDSLQIKNLLLSRHPLKKII